MISSECVVIGAGFAGAATAYHLTRLGLTDILLLERETIPGFHSSGRNAAMIRQCVPDSALAQLTRDGAVFLRNLPSDWPVPVQFKQNGSLLLGSGKGWEKLRHDTEIGLSLDVEVSLWTPEQAKKPCSGPQRSGIRRRGLVRYGRDYRYSRALVGLPESGNSQGHAHSLWQRSPGHSPDGC